MTVIYSLKCFCPVLEKIIFQKRHPYCFFVEQPERIETNLSIGGEETKQFQYLIQDET